MSPETRSNLAKVIWRICNLLRGPYKRNEYRKVSYISKFSKNLRDMRLIRACCRRPQKASADI